eukprot:CAMPEP_0180344180 /NCGR_PEP_ID=MMETSP0989-20121125/2681_1 /TAXON_ID=697907 /ORGANISM="non described non described, Strain CCMP2293" /LENGTH=65 /DNA_ID=CAMNT_0022333185 /DNA_START=512 /DNA_END=709 /DNA_ORIENTATION=+
MYQGSEEGSSEGVDEWCWYENTRVALRHNHYVRGDDPRNETRRINSNELEQLLVKPLLRWTLRVD